MRPLLLLFLTFVTTSAAAQQPVGLQELQPAIGSRKYVTGASSRTAHLVVWIDSRAITGEPRLMAARLDGEGRVLDPEGIVLGRSSGVPVAGSDGEDWLVLEGGRAYRVRADGTFTSLPFREQRVRALAWNGTAYLALAERMAFVLDAEGREVRRPVQWTDEWPIAIAGHAGRWLVATSGALYALTPDDFPLAGPPAPPPAARWKYDRWVDTGLVADAIGFLSVRRTAGGLIVQRHAADGSPVLRAVTYRGITALPTTIAAAHGALYLANPDPPVVTRLAGGRAAVLELPATAAPDRYGHALMPLVSASGVVAVWREDNQSQLYAARLGSGHPPALIGKGLAWQYTPRLVSGAGVHLAAWLERDTSGVRVTAAILGDDGRQLSDTLVLGDPARAVFDLEVAADGAGFLVVWREEVRNSYDRKVSRAAIVPASGSGVRVFDLPDLYSIASVVWDGTTYLVSSLSGVVRVTAGGVVLDSAPRFLSAEVSTELVLVQSGRELRGLARWWEGDPCSATFCVWYEYAFLRVGRDLRVSGGKNIHFSTYRGGPDAAVAAGNGRTFAVAYDKGGDYIVANDTGMQKIADYEKIYPPPRRLHAVWNGSALLVTAGRQLAEHDVDGRLLRKRQFAPQATETAITLDVHGRPLLLSEELRPDGTPRLWVRAPD